MLVTRNADLTPREPLGLEYLTILVGNHEVEIFDCRGNFPGSFKFLPNNLVHIGASPGQIRAKIVDYEPEIVGITSLFDTQINSVYCIFNIVKEVDKDIVTAIGGCTASCYPEETLNENRNIDIAVVGEGETTFKEILDNDAKNLSGIDGIVYRNGSGIIIRNKPRKLIKDLDSIPFPRRDMIPFENYAKPPSKWNRAIFSLKTRGLKHLFKSVLHIGLSKATTQIERKGKEAKLLTSRGCPYSCYFCAVRSVWGCSYRMRSAENVLQEMQQLYDKYNIRHFGIVDDNFNASKKRTIDICKGIVERGMDVSLRADSGTYLSSIDEGVLTWMKKAGFNELYFAIESGNERIAKEVIRKNVNLQQAKDVARICKNLDITSGGFFIVGIPGETKETMRQTVQFAIDSGLDRIRLYTCQPYRGSQLYEDAKKKGWITNDFNTSKSLIFESKSYFKTEDFSPEDVYNIVEEGKRILRQQKRLEG